MSFTGRQAELDILRSELDVVRKSGEGRFVWVRGRRRVGKSRLVQEFCNHVNAPYAFYQAPRRDQTEALAAFTKSIAASSLPAADTFEGVSYPSWPSAIRAAVREVDPAQPAILVIDELPYLAEFDSGFTADLQMAWDRTLERAPVLLVCVGSDVRMMESMVEERSPLFGRPTREMRVSPLNPVEVAEINSAPDATAAVDRYLVLGGFPLLAPTWPASAGLAAFLRKALADDQTPFVTTALRILASEFESALQAERVIEAIGHGESAYNRIQARSGVKGNTLTDALDMLIEKKGLVAKDLPYAVPAGRKAAKYTVADPYLRFWLRFVGPHLDELSRGMSDLVDRTDRAGLGYLPRPGCRAAGARPRSSACSTSRRPPNASATRVVSAPGGGATTRSRSIWSAATVRTRPGSDSSARSSGASGGASRPVTSIAWGQVVRRCPGPPGPSSSPSVAAASPKGSPRMQGSAPTSCWRPGRERPSAACSTMTAPR